MKYKLHKIPDALRELDQWLLWREEIREDDTTKVPRQPDGDYASSTDADTWTDFESVLKAYRSGDFDGIGFVFTENDDFVGADLDDCVEDGSLTRGALDVVDQLDSYTEGSPSGTGLHIILEGFLIRDRNRTGNVDGMEEIEIYEDGRYFTFTGRHLDGTPGEPQQRARELHALCEDLFEKEESEETPAPSDPIDLDDRELIEKARTSKHGSKFERLWSGDTSGYESHSEADQALASKLAFWTAGDRDRIDQLFRQSGLCRDKWTDRPDYRRRTIDKALEGRTEFYDPSRSSKDAKRSDAGPSPKERVDEVVAEIEEEDAGAELVFEHLDAFARLDTADFAVAKEKISDVVNLNDFQAAIREKRREVERKDFQKGSDLPTIQLSGRPGREVVDEAKAALRDWNDPPVLFQRGTEPVQIATDDRGRPVIRELPEPVMDDCLDRAADFYRSTEKKGAVRADLSKRYVDRIMQTVDLPPLNSIVEVPVLREDGSILDETGYDESSRLYYEPNDDLTVPEILREPTEEQIEDAKEAIWEPLQDFPFVDEASRANALALMLTPIVRPHLGEQNVPLAIVDATVQGTGKTLFVKVVSITSTGRPAATMNAPEGDEEWRKQITAQLLQGASIIAVDNVRGRLQSAPLEQALTTSLWQDRVLGKSQQVELPQRATWIATGNNVQPKGDMKRRVYPIRMDAEMERPWMGREFEIDNLQQWTKDHRGKLVAALLTLARGWFAAGRPAPETELIGSFEKWTRTVGGILEHAGITSFLDNLDEMLETVDDEAAEWTGFLAALDQYFQYEFDHGNREEPTFTSNELDSLIRESYEKDPSFRDHHLGEIIEQLPGYLVQKLDRGEKISQSLGNMFANRRGRRFGPQEWFVEIAYTRNRAKRWVVRCGQRQTEVIDESNESSNTPAGESPPPTLDEGGGSSQQSGVDPDSLDSPEMEPDDKNPF